MEKKYYVKVVEYPYLLCHKKFENRWVECDPHSFAENAKTLLKQKTYNLIRSNSIYEN